LVNSQSDLLRHIAAIQNITRHSADENRQTQADRVRMDEVFCVHSEDHQHPN